MSYVTLTVDNYIAQLTLNRTSAGNSINFAVMDELDEKVTEVLTNKEIRVLILTGSGRFFISGGDLKEFHSFVNEGDGKRMAERMQGILLRLERAPCFTIAGVNGLAYGGGCETMLACDFIVASPKAVFGFTQGKFYLPPGWGGLTRLKRRVGVSKTLQWLGACSVLTAEMALQEGLINYITSSDDNFTEELWSFAHNFTHNDQNFIANLKKHGYQQNIMQEDGAIASETHDFAKFWASSEHLDRVEEFLKSK